MKKFYALFVVAVVIHASACSTEKIKDKINKTGDVAGQAVGEFTSGVTSGIEKSIEPKVILSDVLKNSGISFGKILVSGDSTETDNVLTIYVIFDQDFKGTLTAKAFDNKKREMGRVKKQVVGKKDETQYIDFHFDRRADIDNDSELLID